MRKPTAIAWFACCAFTVGCSATTTVEENVPVADDPVPVTENNAIVPRDQQVEFPPLEAPPDDLTQTLPGVTPGTATEEEPVVSEVPAVELPKPRVFEGNPTCEEAFGVPGLLAMTFEQQRRAELVDGSYTSGDGLLTITIDFSDTSVDYTSTGGVVGVIVKGGAHAVAYPSESGAGTDLTTPAGEELSHVTVCYLP